jgi:hypothetical protein
VLYQPATCLSHVENAWKLVYERYVGSGLISPNPFGIHTSPHAIHTDTCVVFGQCSNTRRLTSTMTLIPDAADGLSLDSVYHRELGSLRRKGRKLMEVGLLVAECRATVSRDITALFELMKWGVYYGLHLGINDIVIGVHPRHVRFYTRWFSFEQFAPERTYPVVRNRPVVPLRLSLKEKLAVDLPPRGLRHVRDNPVAADAFGRRYSLRHQELTDSSIERFINAHHRPDRSLRRPGVHVLPQPALVLQPI